MAQSNAQRLADVMKVQVAALRHDLLFA